MHIRQVSLVIIRQIKYQQLADIVDNIMLIDLTEYLSEFVSLILQGDKVKCKERETISKLF